MYHLCLYVILHCIWQVVGSFFTSKYLNNWSRLHRFFFVFREESNSWANLQVFKHLKTHRESKKGSGLFPSPASGSVVVLGWHHGSCITLRWSKNGMGPAIVPLLGKAHVGTGSHFRSQKFSLRPLVVPPSKISKSSLRISFL